VLLKILKDSELCQRDCANLRLVCTHWLPYATEAFGEKCFNGGLCLSPSAADLVFLAALCSSQLGPYLSSVHFAHAGKHRAHQKIKGSNPDYSTIRIISFGNRFEAPFALRTFEKMLHQLKHLETIIFDTGKPKNGNRLYIPRKLFSQYKAGVVARYEGREMMDTILSSITSDRLTKLIFTSNIASYQTLEGLLARHRGTVRRLAIRSCKLIGGTWIDLLQWISHNLPSLEYLVLKNLRELRRIGTSNNYDDSAMMWETSVTTTGKKNIDTYIATLGEGDTSD
jgi:hypothetical protein